MPKKRKMSLHKKWILLSLFSTFTMALSNLAHSAPYLSEKVDDWLLDCDNTGTCRAHGYQTWEESNFILGASILLERAAGANSEVQGFIQLNMATDRELPKNFSLLLNQKNYGDLENPMDDQFTLTRTQLAGILQSPKTLKNIVVEINFKNLDTIENIKIPGAGLLEILLKMDEFQKRIGTSSALIQKGDLPEDNVLKPIQIPSITIPLLTEKEEDLTYFNKHLPEIRTIAKSLFVESDENICWTNDDSELEQMEIILYGLDKDHVLVTHQCYLAAYNYGYAYYVIDRDLKMRSQPIIGQDYEHGEIFSSHKGRGLGDCWSFHAYAWNGQTLVQTEGGYSGSCRGMPGGFWTIPQVVTKVVNLNR